MLRGLRFIFSCSVDVSWHVPRENSECFMFLTRSCICEALLVDPSFFSKPLWFNMCVRVATRCYKFYFIGNAMDCNTIPIKKMPMCNKQRWFLSNIHHIITFHDKNLESSPRLAGNSAIIWVHLRNLKPYAWFLPKRCEIKTTRPISPKDDFQEKPPISIPFQGLVFRF